MRVLFLTILTLSCVQSFGQLINSGRPVITKRASYTPTLDSLLQNSTANAAKHWRVGDEDCVEGGFTMTGSGTGAESLTVSLPSGETIDTAKLSTGTNAGNATGGVLGFGTWFQSGTGWLFLVPTYNSTTTIRFYMNSQVLAASQLANNDGVHYSFCVPIVGW